MHKPFGAIADVHLERWSAFSKINEDGVNSRLRLLLDEIWRVASHVNELGGDRLYIAGDLFHKRDSVSPEVLNPTIELFEKITEEFELSIVIIAGNHDLSSKDATTLGNACVSLERIDSSRKHTIAVWSTTFNNFRLSFVPWFSNQQDTFDKLKKYASPERIAIIHAPINGVIKGLNGLNAEDLADLGYKAILAGHYHNHKAFPGNVYSIGAIAHHTWSDVGSQAGYMIYKDDEFTFHESSLPKFVDMTSYDLTNAEILEHVANESYGNYAKIALPSDDEALQRQARELFKECGCEGLVIEKKPKSSVTTRTTKITSKTTLADSVSQFIEAKGYGNAKQVNDKCQSLLVRT